MARVAIRGYSYCLNHTPELGLHYGVTPYIERITHLSLIHIWPWIFRCEGLSLCLLYTSPPFL